MTNAELKDDAEVKLIKNIFLANSKTVEKHGHLTHLDV